MKSDPHPSDGTPDASKLAQPARPGAATKNDIAYAEGARVTLEGGNDYSTERLFVIAVLGSFALEGKPVRCTGIVPGVTMRATSGALIASDNADAEHFAYRTWDQIRPQLASWLARSSPDAITVRSSPPGLLLEFSRGGQHLIGHGAMQITVEYAPDASVAYAADRARRPLIEVPRGPGETATSGQLEDLRRLLDDAVRATEDSVAPRYDRLPVPVRFRASGANESWARFRLAAARLGGDLEGVFATAPIASLVRGFPIVVEHLVDRSLDQAVGARLASLAVHNVVWQAFNVRKGALYEPTPALHRLLQASFIADDVPVGMIAMPTDTMCIIPDPSLWEKGVCAIGLFRHRRHADGSGSESISCITVEQRRHPARGLTTNVFEIRLDDPDKTIGQDLDDAVANIQPKARGARDDEAREIREHWRGALDYVVKMLLYLDVGSAEVNYDRSYTLAPRDFSGIGQRRRAERLFQIEQLYDRHIVGPAILDAELAASVPGDGAHHEVSFHWRRPHFRTQPYGPRASLRKVVFIGPTVVRPDRVGV